MRTFRIVAASCLLLAFPMVGSVQQAPGEVRQPRDGIPELQELLKVQTAAIKALRTRLETLEARVKTLEQERAPAAGDPR
jgi:hypothetical protein